MSSTKKDDYFCKGIPLCFNCSGSDMKIVLVLYAVFLGYVLTTFQNDGINHAETSGIKRLTEQVGSYECKEGGCLIQDAILIPNNPVIVHKRHAKHRKHKKTKAVRRHIRQNKKKARLLNKRIRNAVNKMKKDTIKSTNARKKRLYMMTRSIPSIVELSKAASIGERRSVKNITVLSTKHTLKLVNASVDELKSLLKESAKNVNKLTKMSFRELKTLSHESTGQVKKALKSGDETGAIDMLDENAKYFASMTESVVSKIEQYYALAEKEAKDLMGTSEALIKKIAESQVVLMKQVRAKTPDEKKNLNSASRRIKSFSTDTADMFNEMIPGSLRLVENLVKHNVELIKKISEQSYKIGENTIAAHKEDDEEKEDSLFAKMVKQFEEEHTKAYKHALAMLDKIVPKLPNKGNVLISSLENTNVK